MLCLIFRICMGYVKMWGTQSKQNLNKKKPGVFVKYDSPRWQQSLKLAIFSIKVKVTRSLTLVSFEMVS